MKFPRRSICPVKPFQQPANEKDFRSRYARHFDTILLRKNRIIRVYLTHYNAGLNTDEELHIFITH